MRPLRLVRIRSFLFKVFRRQPDAKRPLPALVPTSELEIEFPVEFFVQGTPLSSQAKSTRHKEAWKQEVQNAYLPIVPEGKWATESPVQVTIYYFPDGPVSGDIDNILKFILDAMKSRIFVDDAQVRRLVAQRFGNDEMTRIENPSPKLSEALETEPPVVYIRIDIDSEVDGHP